VEWVEVPITIAAKKKGLGSEVLHGKTKGIKFNGNKVVTCKFANGYKVCDYVRGNKDIL
jgi:predicted GNAT superfamily acetyltransferase